MEVKGDRQDCTNYRGITLLSVPGKVLAHILLSRIRPHLLQTQRPAQSGFTPKKSTVDRILALRILVERRLEFRQRVFAAYVDLKKAFDSVHREALWRIMEHRGIPAGIVALLASLYSGTVSAVRVAGGISEFFPVNSGVRQGCVLAPTLFNACMDWVLGRTVERSNCGASVGDVNISDLDFADDAVILAELLDVLESSLVILKEETVPLGLEISWTKTRLQAFGDLMDEAVQALSIQGESVDFDVEFTYLGSVIQSNMGCDREIFCRLGLPRGVMDSLDWNVWRSRYLCRRTRVRAFRVLVLPILLHGCETWEQAPQGTDQLL